MNEPGTRNFAPPERMIHLCNKALDVIATLVSGGEIGDTHNENLYSWLSENVGMSDEEIKAAGFDCVPDKIAVLMELNTWANRCGYFFNAYLTPKDPKDESFYPGRDPSPNNGYNCRHPDCEESSEGVGCCFSWACPLAYEADEQDCEAFGVEYEESEFVVVEIKPEDYCESRMWKRKDDSDAS